MPPLFPGVARGSKHFKALDLPLGVITNKAEAFHPAPAAAYRPLPFFDVIVSGDVLPRPKPDPMPLLWASGRLGVSPVDVLMIGDSVHDFHAGRAAGCHVFLVPYGYNEGRDVRDLACDGIVSTLAEAAQRLFTHDPAPLLPSTPARAEAVLAMTVGCLVAARPGASLAGRTSSISCGVPMTEAYFNRLAAEGYNRIPVTLETFADLDTPLSIYLKLANNPYSYLLESVQGGERFGRYSIIGLASPTRIVVNAHQVLVLNGNRIAEREDDTNPLDFIGKYMKRFRAAPTTGLPRFCGGLVGCFGYDTVRYIETRLTRSQKADDLGIPDIVLLLSEEIAVVDNLSGKLTLVVYAEPGVPGAYQKAQARLRELLARLREPVAIPPETPQSSQPAARCLARHAVPQAVIKAKRYITEGDIMQVVLSQRMSKPLVASPMALYRSLRSLNPSPYMFYFDFEDFHVVGASPEILVRLEGDTVTVRPIAGTRRRGVSFEEDQALAAELLADEKERAEHVQLLDLGRNDAGRVAASAPSSSPKT
jgi:anthranilate synthase component 1